MSDLRYIKMEALSIPVGQSQTVYCCFCDNDPPYAPSLSLTRVEEGILYNCFRACCSGHGLIGSLPTNMVTKGVQKDFVPRPYTKPSMIADPQRLEDLWGLTPQEVTSHGIRAVFDKYNGEQGYLFPLYTKDGMSFGHTTKILNATMKAKHYLQYDKCMLHYARIPAFHRGTVIIVEDVISSIRVSRFHQGIALLGTALNDKKIKDLIAFGATDVIMALDPDALDKALAFKRKWGIFFNTFRVVSLSADPKDMKHEQLKKELEL